MNRLLAAASLCALITAAAPLAAHAATMQCQPQQVIGTIYPTGTTYTADTAGIVQGVATNDVNQLHQAGCVQLGLTDGICGELLQANMNSSSDQPFAWFLSPTQHFRVVQITATNAKRSYAAGSAEGGVYTAPAEGGTAVVAATQLYAGLVHTLATANLDLTLVSGVGTLGEYANGPLVLTLDTPDGTAGTLDFIARCQLGN